MGKKFLTAVCLLVFLLCSLPGGQNRLYAQSLSSSQVNAQNFRDDPNLPFDSTATADDITSMYFNPAGIGVHPLQVGVFYGNNNTDKLQDYLLFLNFFGLAFSTQWRQSSSNFNAQRFTVGSGLSVSRLLSLGTTYSWYHSSESLLNNYSEWDIGLIFRPFRWLSLGGVARGLNLPMYQSVTIKPRLDVGIGLRPIPGWTEKLTLSADATFYFDQRMQNIIPRLTAEFVPVSGLTLYGGSINFQDYYFGIKIAQNITQISFQGSIPHDHGQFYSGGVLISQERFKTAVEAIRYYLEIPLSDAYPETSKKNFILFGEKLTFYDVIKNIKAAIKDPQIRGIVLRSGRFNGGWGQAEELRAALLQFKEASGKPVYAFIDSGANIDYYISTAADAIIMPPSGNLRLTGLKAEAYYLKGLLNILGIEPDFIKMGDYKSAPEMFTNKKPDHFEQEQIKQLLENIQHELKQGILTRRKKIEPGKLDTLLDYGLFTARKAKEAGLIDESLYFPEVKEKYLKVKSSNINWGISLKDYAKEKLYSDDWGIRPKIALLLLEGEITANDKTFPFVGNGQKISLNRTIKALEKIKADPIVRAVVIRIDSPGGSAFASDLLWKEIRLLQQKKPVIISIGDTAASGGYYLAVGSDEILSDQTSVTGSIGVFTGKFSLKKLYKKLGINKEVYKLNSKGAIFSETDTFSDEERKMIKNQMAEFYQLFLDRVEKSRTNLSRKQIEENANGRVYTGLEAKKRGMVDKIGGLSLALEIAKNKARLKDDYVNIETYPAEEKLNILANNTVIPLPNILKNAIKVLDEHEKLESGDNLLFLMPVELDIK